MAEIIGSIIVFAVALVVVLFSIDYAHKKEEEFIIQGDRANLLEITRKLIENNVRDTKRKDKMLDYIDHDDLYGLMKSNDNVFQYMVSIYLAIALGYLLIAAGLLFTMLYISINSIIQDGFVQTFIENPPNSVLVITIIVASILFLISSRYFFVVRRNAKDMEDELFFLLEK